LCETLAGNKIDVLTITSKQNMQNYQQRKGVILTGRVHPGESVGSWMMKGALDFLVDPESLEAEYLR
jgi:cytosolic carboxypeptidase protein 2/3